MTDPLFGDFDPPRVVYVDSSALALALALTDPGERGARVAEEMASSFSAASEVVLYEVPRLVTGLAPDFVREASFFWVLVLNELDLTQVATYDLEMAGARAWGHPERHAVLHVITAEKISAHVFVTGDADTGEVAEAAGVFSRVVVV